jgi:hypothetical protein
VNDVSIASLCISVRTNQTVIVSHLLFSVSSYFIVYPSDHHACVPVYPSEMHMQPWLVARSLVLCWFFMHMIIQHVQMPVVLGEDVVACTRHKIICDSRRPGHREGCRCALDRAGPGDEVWHPYIEGVGLKSEDFWFYLHGFGRPGHRVDAHEGRELELQPG